LFLAGLNKFFIEQDGAALFSNSLLVACHDSGKLRFVSSIRAELNNAQPTGFIVMDLG